jgi:hypothetical protein
VFGEWVFDVEGAFRMSVGIFLASLSLLSSAPADAGLERLLYCIVPKLSPKQGDTPFDHLSVYLPSGTDTILSETIEVFDPHKFLGGRSLNVVLLKDNGFTVISSSLPVAQIHLVYVPDRKAYEGLVGYDGTKPKEVACVLIAGASANELATKFRIDPKSVDHIR